MKRILFQLGVIIALLLCMQTDANSHILEGTYSSHALASAGTNSMIWKERGIKVILIALGLGGIYLVYHMRLNQMKQEESLKAEFSRQLADMQMKVLKAQMNPHFIFNSLNSINWYIIKSETEKASLYLTKFSKLIRLILDNSNHKIISLHQELTALKLYLEMEALRFNEKFTYSFSIDRELNPLSVGVPPMIIQPFVENAIWQGLLHKEADGKIEIGVYRMNGGLKYTITDNGMGRKKNDELNHHTADKDKANGMKINGDRLQMLNRESCITSVETIDLENANGEPMGTQVIVKMLSAELEPEF
jgi:sensor histidine kinase YesM